MPDSDQCLSCHSQDSKRMNFTFAEHHKAGVQCSDCHGVHSPKLGAPGAGMERFAQDTALCANCHQDVLVRFGMRSHHAVREGALACNTCHDPHGSKQTSLAAKTAQCTECHQAVRGPHAFEHAPVAEDCTTCHNPHGSPNRQLLELAQPMLCLQCHSVAGNRHGATGAGANNQVISATALRNCSSCHNAVHGSHMDQHLRF
jgi:DmsE family decaheme c-type cytochrome